MKTPGEGNKFLRARSGDQLFCPFEYDLCAFFRLKPKPLDPKSSIDSLLLMYIRRAYLVDAFWSRGSGTVEGMR